MSMNTRVFSREFIISTPERRETVALNAFCVCANPLTKKSQFKKLFSQVSSRKALRFAPFTPPPLAKPATDKDERIQDRVN